MAMPSAAGSASDFGLDDLLLDVCEELQITETQEQRARTAYGAVGEWLAGDGSPLRTLGVRVYPQGSLALRTTTKPRGKEEYDLDIVCEVARAPASPLDLYDLVLRRLKQHADYSKRLVEMKRCVRLDYAGDFHLDVLPGRPQHGGQPNAIQIPDTDLEQWHPTNPIEFIRWFEEQVRRQRSRVLKAMQAPLPAPLAPEVAGPLRNSVQLTKRYRDNQFYFVTEDVAPRSIVLTALSGEIYDGSESLSETFANVAAGMMQRKREADSRHQRLVVRNPVSPSEDFSERWVDPRCYQAFGDLLSALAVDLARLQRARGLGEVSRVLDEMFGDNLGVRSVDRYSRRVQAARERRVLGPTAMGGLSSAARRPAQPHTFHHD